jgi:hypothetical protein
MNDLRANEKENALSLSSAAKCYYQLLWPNARIYVPMRKRNALLLSSDGHLLLPTAPAYLLDVRANEKEKYSLLYPDGHLLLPTASA